MKTSFNYHQILTRHVEYTVNPFQPQIEAGKYYVLKQPARFQRSHSKSVPYSLPLIVLNLRSGCKIFKRTNNQKSEGFRSSDVEGQVVRKWWLLILLFPICLLTNCISGFAVDEEKPVCIKIILARLARCWSALIICLLKSLS